MEQDSTEHYRPPISPSEFVMTSSEPEQEEETNNLNLLDDDDEGSSIDLNDFDDEFDSEDPDDAEELLFQDKAIEFSVEESSNDEEEELDECQQYIDKFTHNFQYSEEEIRHFCREKSKEKIQNDLIRFEERLVKLKDTAIGNFKGLDTTLKDIIIHQLALQEMEKQVVKKKKRVDTTLNKNTRPNRKRKSAPNIEEDDPNDDFIDDRDVEEVLSQDEEPQERIVKTVILNEKEKELSHEIEKCIMEKDNLKFREYLRMYARREIPIAVAFETRLAFHFRNQQYERERIRNNALKKEKNKSITEKEEEQYVIEEVKESVNFVKEDYGEYLLEYQDYVMDHQIDCLRKAITRMMQGKSLLIAHSMGLGKTLTVLLILKNYHRIFSENKIGKSMKYLILVPKSNIDHFEKQYAYHFPSGGFLSSIIVIKDNNDISTKLLDFDKGGRMLVMTYDRCARILKENDKEANYLKDADILVIDEAHIIKNPETEKFKQFSKFTKSLKLLVTGTPLQNNISEIYTLIRFLEPENPYVQSLNGCLKPLFTDFFKNNRANIDNREVLARVQVFYEYFEDLIHRKVNIKEMEEISKKKEDIIIEFKMGKEEQEIYDFISNNCQKKCYFARYFYQRLCLDCIEYLKSTSEKDLEEFSQDFNYEDELTEKKFLETLKKHIEENFTKNISSTRLGILKTLVSQIVRGSKVRNPEKVVIFSGLVCYNQEIMEKLKSDKKIKVKEFTGETSSTNRSLIIEEFNKGIINTLLISKNAGGVGIDLTTATNVILFNLDFNFAKDDQAICRLVRKNQEKQVKIFRLVCRNSVDMAVKTLQAHKTVIFDKLLDDISARIKPPRNDSIPEELCKIVFGEKIVPRSIKDHIVNIERFKLTEDSKDVTDQEVKCARVKIENVIEGNTKYSFLTK